MRSLHGCKLIRSERGSTRIDAGSPLAYINFRYVSPMALIPCRECGRTISSEAVACPQCGAPPLAAAAPPQIIAPALPTDARREAQEETLHSDPYVSVTSSRVIIRGTTYALRNITSVRMTVTAPNTTLPTLMIVFGAIVLFMALLSFLNSAAAGLTTLVIAAAIIGLGVLWLRSLKTFFHVAIASSSGEANALSSIDRSYIDAVVQSINKAIVQYR